MINFNLKIYKSRFLTALNIQHTYLLETNFVAIKIKEVFNNAYKIFKDS